MTVDAAISFALTYFNNVTHLYWSTEAVVGESHIVSPPFNSGTCKRCGGAFQYAATLPKSAENDHYDIYQCADCRCMEWVRSTSLGAKRTAAT